MCLLICQIKMQYKALLFFFLTTMQIPIITKPELRNVQQFWSFSVDQFILSTLLITLTPQNLLMLNSNKHFA